jgi:neutral trehalase
MDVSSIIDGLDLTIYSLNEKLWDEEYGIYRSYNLVQNDSILSGSIGGLLPLVGGIPNQEQAEMIRQALEANFIQSDYWWLPTYSLNSPQILSDQLGQGSVDPIVNWLMYYGLLRYDFTDLAELLRRNTLLLIKEYGFYSAYDAKKQDIGNVGLGSGNFGPAAAVYLDLAAKKAVRNSIK